MSPCIRDYHKVTQGFKVQDPYHLPDEEDYHWTTQQNSTESLQEVDHYPTDDESQTSHQSDSTDSDHSSTESSLSGETAVESPTESTDLAEYLPKVSLEEDQDPSSVGKKATEAKVHQSEDRPLNYVDALRLRRGKARSESRGLWDYWNNKTGVGVK